MPSIEWILALLLFAGGELQQATSAAIALDVAVEIEIVADSSNTLRAQVRVPAGTNARDLMDKLFQMEYLDSSRKFVLGIAGYQARPREKKFWKLEVGGVASQVGVAEISLTGATRLRWVITAY